MTQKRNCLLETVWQTLVFLIHNLQCNWMSEISAIAYLAKLQQKNFLLTTLFYSESVRFL